MHSQMNKKGIACVCVCVCVCVCAHARANLNTCVLGLKCSFRPRLFHDRTSLGVICLSTERRLKCCWAWLFEFWVATLLSIGVSDFLTKEFRYDTLFPSEFMSITSFTLEPSFQNGRFFFSIFHLFVHFRLFRIFSPYLKKTNFIWQSLHFFHLSFV